MPQADRPSSLQERCDFLYFKISEFSGHDLTGFFDYYGLPITAAARMDVSSLNLPEPATPVWSYRE